jgi:hypothetical protein
MRTEAIEALKVAATKLKPKSLLEAFQGNELYEEAEKYYYEPEDEFPLKYIAALRSLAFAVRPSLDEEIENYCAKAAETELEKEMRTEAIEALKIAATNLKPKSLLEALIGNELYEEAEKYYYDPEDEFPLKYIAALRSLAFAEQGNNPQQQQQDEEETPPPPPTITTKVDKRQLVITQKLDHFIQRAETEELDKEMREEGKKAIRIAVDKFAYQKKYYDVSRDRVIVFPTVAQCLVRMEVYEEAEKHYYDPCDDYPLKYIAALKEVAFQEQDWSDDDDLIEQMNAMGQPIDPEDPIDEWL